MSRGNDDDDARGHDRAGAELVLEDDVQHVPLLSDGVAYVQHALQGHVRVGLILEVRHDLALERVSRRADERRHRSRSC